jgi:hypothetical protein
MDHHLERLPWDPIPKYLYTAYNSWLTIHLVLSLPEHQPIFHTHSVEHLLLYNTDCVFLPMQRFGAQFEYLMEISKELPDYKYSSLMVSEGNIFV